MTVKRILVLVALLAATSCGSSIELSARSAKVPVGIDLSGQWSLRSENADSMHQIARAGADAVGGDAIIRSRREPAVRRTRKAKGGLLHVFLETGRSLKITQTAHGLFISFDRAIVEEYTFGELREVAVGPVIADRVSGWDGNSYVIETLDNDGAILTERYRLESDANVLIRDVYIVKNERRELDVRQLFDRIQGQAGDGS